MPTIPKTKATRNSVVSFAVNPWDTVAEMLEQLGEGQQAVLVVDQLTSPINPHRTKHRAVGAKVRPDWLK
jgi:hypothetical protein